MKNNNNQFYENVDLDSTVHNYEDVSTSMTERFLSVLQNLDISPDACIYVGVSGGSDSMALVTLLGEVKHRLKQKIYLAHFVHGIRSIYESERDKNVIIELSKKYQLPVLFGYPSPPIITTTNIEQTARTARRRFLTALCTNIEDRVILAHHKEDNIETIYMRLLHNSPLAGLKGISSKQGYFIRPLLSFHKKELIQFLIDNDVNWNEDSTNQSSLYLRNRTRYILDKLTAVEPTLPQALCNLAERVIESEQSHETLLTLLHQFEKFDEETYSLTFPYDKFCSLPTYLQHKFVYKWFNQLMKSVAPPDFRLPGRFVKSIILDKQGPILLRGYGIIIQRKKNAIICEREKK